MSDVPDFLERYRERFEAGDPLALFDAIKVCGENRITLPHWLVCGFSDAYDKVITFEVRSLDEAFGQPHPKGANMKALRNRRKLAWRVYNAVTQARAQARQNGRAVPIDEWLFAAVGEEFEIGKTLASECYYEFKAFIEAD